MSTETLTEAQAQTLADLCRDCATGKEEPDLCEFCGFATVIPAPFNRKPEPACADCETWRTAPAECQACCDTCNGL